MPGQSSYVCVCEVQMAIRALETIQFIEHQCATSRQSCSTLSALTSSCFHHQRLPSQAFKKASKMFLMDLLMANKSLFTALHINNKPLITFWVVLLWKIHLVCIVPLIAFFYKLFNHPKSDRLVTKWRKNQHKISLWCVGPVSLLLGIVSSSL